MTEAACCQLEGRLDDLAAELLASPAWQQASSPAARKQAAGRFLVPHVDGFSPSPLVRDELYARAQRLAKAARAAAGGCSDAGLGPGIVPAMYRDPDEPTSELFRVMPSRRRKPGGTGDLGAALHAARVGHHELREALDAARGTDTGTLDPGEPAAISPPGGPAARQRRPARLQRALARVDVWILIATLALVALGCLALAWS